MTSTPTGSMRPHDLIVAAAATDQALQPHLSLDWKVPAGALAWSCRRTLDHIVDALLLYAQQLATRSTTPRTFIRDGDPHRSLRELLDAVSGAAHILDEVVRAADLDTRAFHPSGLADADGFAAMGIDELLIHSDDIATGLGVRFFPPTDLAARLLGRLFPWAPSDEDAWSVLRWANGRIALPRHPRLGEDWYWHSAPLEEWDGSVARRRSPPAW
jgi:hypothetical protein